MLGLTIWMATVVTGQRLYYPVEYTGIGPTAINSGHLSAPAYSVQHPAAPVTDANFSAAVYAEKKYMSSELVNLLAVSTFSNEKSSTLFAFQQFGYTGYRERQVTLGYCKNLGAISAGVQFRYIITKSLHQKIISGIWTMAGAAWKLSETVTAAIKLVNPRQFFQTSDSTTFRFASAFQLGFGYQVNESLYIGIESAKEEQQPHGVAALILFKPADKYLIRAWWITHSNQPGLIIAWKSGATEICTGISYHRVLGITPSAGLVLHSKKK